MTGLTLMAIGDQLGALEQLLIESDGEWNETMDAWLAEYGQLERAKVDHLVGFLKSKDAYAKACKEQADELGRKAQVAENTVKRLKAYALTCLQLQNRDKIAGDIWTIARQANGGKQPLTLLVEDPAKLPGQFVTMKPIANTDAIRAAVEAGDTIALTVARLEPRWEHVRVR